MKFINITKAILYVALAVFIFVFQDRIMPFVGYLVGGVVGVYALEEFLVILFDKKETRKRSFLFDVITQLLISIVLMLSAGDIVKVCVIWGVWAILRESKEMTEAIDSIFKYGLGIINIAESVTIIILSFILILHPTEEHAHLHIILLGVELLLVIFFSFAEKVIDAITLKKKGTVLSKEGSDVKEDMDDPTL